MSNNLPSFQACADARHKLEAAIKLAEGIHWLNGIAREQSIESLREEFIEQLQAAARALDLELVRRQPKPEGGPR